MMDKNDRLALVLFSDDAKIYCDLENISNVYIGKTERTVKERFQEHIQDAMSGHRNFKLHNAIRKYGPEHFHYDILGEYPDEELNSQEIYWIEFYDSYINGWNSTWGGDGNVKWTPEMREQQSEIMKNYYKIHDISIETRRKLSEKTKERWNDPEYKERLRQSQLKSYAENPERREIQRINNIKRYEDPLEHKKSSEGQQRRWTDPLEHKKASEGHIKSHGKKVRCVETQIIYNCIADACEAMGRKRTATNISSVLHGQKKTAFGYHWELIE